MHNTMRLTSPARAALVAGALVCAGLALPAQSAAASTPVNCASDSLQTAINNAADGATLVVSGWCQGNFDIIKDITIIGTPGAVLSADDSGNVLGIGGSFQVTLKSLEMTDGRAANGGAIYAPDGGELTLDHVRFDDNAAVSSTSAAGGALYYLGAGLHITHSTFTNNQAEVYGNGAVIAEGGAVFVDGQVSVDHTTFASNSAVISTGVNSSSSSDGAGMAVVNGPLTISSSAFTANTARSSVTNTVSGDLGDSSGAGLWVNANAGPVTVTHTTFTRNSDLVAAPWGGGLAAGAFFGLQLAGTLALTSDTFADNDINMTTTGVNGGNALAGGVYVDAKTAHLSRVNVSGNVITVNAAHTLEAVGGGGEINANLDTISQSSFSNNTIKVRATGSGASDTAQVFGGGVDVQTGSKSLSISASTFANNKVSASSVAGGSSIAGGGLAVTPSASPMNKDRIANSTVTANTIAITGPASNAADGGGLFSTDPALQLQFDTVVANHASAPAKASSNGGGIDWVNAGATAASVEGSLLLGNTAGTGSTCGGTLRSLGYNSFGALSGCAMPPKKSDRAKTSIKSVELEKLAANGGPTRTLALGAHSTALDRVPKATCRAIVTRDQRGVVRPQGAKCDEGAYERRVKR
jgi:hypothetical protein